MREMLSKSQIEMDIDEMRKDLEKYTDFFVNESPETEGYFWASWNVEKLPSMIGTLTRILEGRPYREENNDRF